MATYLEKAKDFNKSFPSFAIEMIPRPKNSHVDTLAKLASTKDAELLNVVSVEFLSKSSINQRLVVMVDPILAYLKIDELLEDKMEARILRVKSSRYVIYNDKLYKRGSSMPLLRCVTLFEADYIMREIHESICENHVRGSH